MQIGTFMINDYYNHNSNVKEGKKEERGNEERKKKSRG